MRTPHRIPLPEAISFCRKWKILLPDWNSDFFISENFPRGNLKQHANGLPNPGHSETEHPGVAGGGGGEEGVPAIWQFIGKSAEQYSDGVEPAG